MSKRKYEDVNGWWLYVIQVPSVGKFYIGVSKCKKCSQRWKKAKYKDSSLSPYLQEWEDMNKNVIQDNLSKKESYQLEDALIQALSRYNLCINKQRSGLITSDENAYYKQYNKQRYENNTEYRERTKQQAKQWREDNREQYNEYQRQYQRQLRLKKKLEKQ